MMCHLQICKTIGNFHDLIEFEKSPDSDDIPKNHDDCEEENMSYFHFFFLICGKYSFARYAPIKKKRRKLVAVSSKICVKFAIKSIVIYAVNIPILRKSLFLCTMR